MNPAWHSRRGIKARNLAAGCLLWLRDLTPCGASAGGSRAFRSCEAAKPREPTETLRHLAASCPQFTMAGGGPLRLVIPLFLAAIAGWTTYVVPYNIASRFLVARGQHGAAIAIIVLHSIFLAMIVASALRLGSTVIFNPGYIPLGTNPDDSSDSEKGRSRRTGSKSKNRDTDFLDRAAIASGTSPSPAPAGLEEFARRDVYVCEPDGLPPFCNYCWVWKPDRTHHNRLLGRCVRRFDHYCPW
jgi:hypothetical protein